MAKAILDNLDSLSDTIKAEYKQVTEEGPLKGKYLLSVDAVGGYALGNIETLQKALSSEREQNKQNKSKLEQFGDVTPDAARSAIAKAAEIAGWDPDKKTAELKKMLEADSQKKIDVANDNLKKLADEKAGLEKILHETIVENTAMAEITSIGGVPQLIFPAIRGSLRLGKDDSGKMRPEVIDAAGNVRMSASKSYTEPMSIKEYVESLRKDPVYARAFDADKRTTTPANRNTPTVQPAPDGTKLSVARRMELARQSEPVKG